jgi:DNA-binding MarR family transcriptional regulator/GNAT superfamily N-acetyltransferase
MSDNHIAEIRAFNRFYTRQLGLLNEHIARSGFSLAEGRVLYEIGQRGYATGRELAAALKVDPAYVSRILLKLLGDGLAASSPRIGDKRSTTIALTKEGDAAVEGLDELNSQAVAALIAAVNDDELPALVAAMKTIQMILGDEPPPPPAPIILRGPQVGDLGWLTQRNGVIYNQQFGWNGDFEALVAGIYREFHELPPDPPKNLWVAERNGRILGSIFVIPFERSTEVAQLRMLYVEPEARGLGIGTLLVKQVVEFSRRSGYRRVRLWTQANLLSARKIYAAQGFKTVGSEPRHSFGKDLVSEFWELEL